MSFSLDRRHIQWWSSSCTKWYVRSVDRKHSIICGSSQVDLKATSRRSCLLDIASRGDPSRWWRHHHCEMSTEPRRARKIALHPAHDWLQSREAMTATMCASRRTKLRLIRVKSGGNERAAYVKIDNLADIVVIEWVDVPPVSHTQDPLKP